MATRDHEQDLLFREIDEDLREERYAKLWKRYGNLIVATAVGVVVVVAGYQGWRQYDREQRFTQGDMLAAAVEKAQTGQSQEALTALTEAAAESRAGYAMLALFQKAAVLGQMGDSPGAAAVLSEIADDSRFETIYRDLAALLAIVHRLDGDSGAGPSNRDLQERLAPLTEEGVPWRFSAREMTAVLALKAGDRKRAQSLYENLVADRHTPQGTRVRAREMLSGLTN